MRLSISVIALLTLSAPAYAQAIDFGDDSSRWAKDGQCDDMRFSGPGMTTTMLLDSDVGHDATDCATAFDAGNLTYDGGDTGEVATVPPVVTPVTPPQTGGLGGGTKGGSEQMQGGGTATPPAIENIVFDGIIFGDDEGPYVADSECDDRRFVGAGMSASISWEHMGHDATDCLAGYQSGALKVWNTGDSMAATQCTSIDFGDDSGEFPTDNECDDYRFEGRGAALNLRLDAVGQDATDCQKLCSFGVVSLRDY